MLTNKGFDTWGYVLRRLYIRLDNKPDESNTSDLVSPDPADVS